jgi:hypothetical protein
MNDGKQFLLAYTVVLLRREHFPALVRNGVAILNQDAA